MSIKNDTPMPAPHHSALFSLSRPISLVGFMGCGKSTLGRALAARLDCPFVDMDDEIARMARRSIPEIFSTLGEAAFRDYETNAAQMLPTPSVVATGGGAFAWPKTHTTLQNQTITVWLRLSWPLLIKRLARERDHRPLLQSKNWKQQAETLYEKRLPWYEKAHVIIDTDHKKIPTLVREILQCPALAPKP